MTDPLHDRLPPQDIDAERAVLGACLIDRSAVDVAIQALEGTGDEAFYGQAHTAIWCAIMALKEGEDDIDLVTVLSCMNSQGTAESAGGGAYISDVSGASPTSANIEHYAMIVREHWERRQAIEDARTMMEASYSGADKPSVVRETMREALDGVSSPSDKGLRPVAGRMGAVVAKMKGRASGEIASFGFQTGFQSLDRLTGGLQPSDMIVVAARPSVGKSALAMNFVWNSVENSPEPQHIVIFSLEMAEMQLDHRLLAMAAGVNTRDYMAGEIYGDLRRMADVRLDEAGATLDQSRIWIDDSPNLSPIAIEMRMSMHARRHGNPDIIIIDYMQLMEGMKGRGSSRQDEVSGISRRCKGLARTYNCPVVAVAQLNREAEGVRPQKSHLRESGAIEQDADLVLFLSSLDEDGGAIYADLSKQRNGPTGVFMLEFHMPTGRMRDQGGPQAETQPRPYPDKLAGPGWKEE